MVLLITFIAAIALFLLSVTVILFIVGPTVLLQPRRRSAEFYRLLGHPATPADAGLPFEEIKIVDEEGLKLDCWMIRAGVPPRGTIIYLHGVADCKIDGIRFAKLMHGRGFDVFLYDSRRHGYSGGTYCTYGYYEKYDLSRVIDYLTESRDPGPGKIGLFGTSMGAAIALQAASIDKRIAAVASENSFSTLRGIFDDYQKRMIKLPFHFLRNLVIIRSEIKAKFKARDVSPLEALANVHIPVLFIYGTADHLIRYQYSLQLYERANQPKEIFPVEGAAHNDIWQIAGGEYEKKLTDFFDKNLKGS